MAIIAYSPVVGLNKVIREGTSMKCPNCDKDLVQTKRDDIEVGIHIDERFIKNGLLDTGAMKPIARAGYQEYFVTRSENRFSVDFARTGQLKPRVQ
jgi:hypothetical protein